MKFEKGKSGNPGGRPKENNEVKALARQYTMDAIKRLAYWMACDDGRVSVAAAQALLDRGHGKPMQAVEHSGPDGGPIETADVTDDMRAKALAAFIARTRPKGEADEKSVH